MASTEELKAALLRAARQQQFLEVVGRDEAEQRFRAHLRLAPLGEERVGLAQALGRVLARGWMCRVSTGRMWTGLRCARRIRRGRRTIARGGCD
jgi:hypothetical protein